MTSEVNWIDSEGRDYGARNDDEFYTVESEIIDVSNGGKVNQIGKAGDTIDWRDEAGEPDFILNNDDEFGFVFKPEVPLEADNPHSVAIKAVVCISVALIIAVAIVVYKNRKALSKEQLRVRELIEQNLRTFGRDDVVVNSAPSGGYHGFYSEVQKVKEKSSHTNDTVSEDSQEGLSEGDALVASFLSPAELNDNDHEMPYNSPAEFDDNDLEMSYLSPVEFDERSHDSYSNDLEMTTMENHPSPSAFMSPVEYDDNDHNDYSNDFELTEREDASIGSRDII